MSRKIKKLINFFKRSNQVQEDARLKKMFSLDDTARYIPVTKNIEVQNCISIFTNLISSMTIKLYENREIGDVRIRNELSHIVDVEPNKKMTRKTFLSFVVKQLLLYGNSYVVIQLNDNEDSDYLDSLIPLDSNKVRVTENGYEYLGTAIHYEQMLHFALDPDIEGKGNGATTLLIDVINSINLSNNTKYKFLKNGFRPSVVVKVTGDDEEFWKEGGQREMAHNFMKATSEGEPVFIPDIVEGVETLKPLTINDLAILENLKLDKTTIANYFGVPLFLIGVGEFKQEEYNLFIKTKILHIAQIIEQELTKKLLLNKEQYFKLNIFSALQYDIEKLTKIGSELLKSGTVTGNEIRNWLGLDPVKELDKPIVLENFLPVGDLGKQKKIAKEKE